ncbi:MAG: phenylalanine--tRNA ligase subunit alpha [Deltaproteobacteria bacterium]|nr:phenylalanine--tRNA ligase subunit alpha [Deltaproteobacteria bacterium]
MSQSLLDSFKKDKESLKPDELINKWLGSKGILKDWFQKLKNLSEDQRVEVGKALNLIKQELEELKKGRSLDQIKKRLTLKPRDLTYSYNWNGVGSLHPVTELHKELVEFFSKLGFELVEGPEVETSFNNFEALNIPEYHPARDMQDTFYINPIEVQSNSGTVEIRDVLRTHTTSIQARVLSRGEFPIKVICFGRVYRNETEDPSHQAMFHQFELLWVDKGLGLPELLSLIEEAMKFLFGKDSITRYVPKYYPYTQPSFGVQTGCIICRGSGCPLCNGSGFITVGGAGVVHPKVLQTFGFDANLLAGLAFGLGSSRLAIQRAGLSKLRLLYDGDLRYL